MKLHEQLRAHVAQVPPLGQLHSQLPLLLLLLLHIIEQY